LIVFRFQKNNGTLELLLDALESLPDLGARADGLGGLLLALSLLGAELLVDLEKKHEFRF
jgi:hypothetical protein